MLFDAQLIGAEYAAILITQDRDQNFILQFDFVRMPIDVEPCGVAARRSIFENIPPGPILRSRGHVIGHDVEHLAELQLLQALTKASVARFPAELFIYLIVINDVVPMHAARRSLQVGRTVNVRDAELFQITCDCDRVIKSEARMQLQPVG